MRIEYNAPVILTLVLVSTVVQLLSELPGIRYLFSVGPGFNALNIVEYFRLFSHVIGHANWAHLIGNMTYILLLGPMLEEKYGSKRMLMMVLVTAGVTGLLNALLFYNALLGASGIVFMLILLSSVVNMKSGRIPLTFVLVVVLFLGQEIISSLKPDQVSQFAHIVGGIFGGLFGFGLLPGKKKSVSKS